MRDWYTADLARRHYAGEHVHTHPDCAPTRTGKRTKPMPKPYRTQGNAGLVETVRSRQTTTLVSIYRAEEAGIGAAGNKYVVVCEPHGALLDAPTLAYAREHRAAPVEWCEDCRRDDGFSDVDIEGGKA